MDRNGFLAITLCVFIFLVWNYFFVPPSKKQEPPPQTMEKKEETTQKQTPKQETALVSKPRVSFDKEELLTVDNDYFTAQIGRSSGALYSWRLKKYSSEEGNPIEMTPPINKTPLEMPLSLTFSSPKLREKNLYPFKLTSQKENKLVFQYEDSEIVVTKEYQFVPSKYLVEASVSAKLRKGLFEGFIEFFVDDKIAPQKKGSFLDFQTDLPSFVYCTTGEKVYRETLEKIKPTEELKQELDRTVLWMGTDSHYFFSGLLNRTSISPRLRFEKNDSQVRAFLKYPIQKDSFEIHYSLFKGPKEIELMTEVAPTLRKSINYGWFRWVAIPLLYVLKWFYKFVHNYGIAIILLTILVKIVFYPLTQKSFASMKDMQRIQPQLNKLREKFKDDKEKMNREVMQLMKTNKVNPVGGCLPMLLQMPVFIALYRVLGVAIELRGTPFVFWIKDLSLRDPYFVTPVLTGIVMFIQQKMTPTMGDPAQAKMMQMMPIIFSVFLLYLPSGLTLYILCNTVLTILQQYSMNRSK